MERKSENGVDVGEDLLRSAYEGDLKASMLAGKMFGAFEALGTMHRDASKEAEDSGEGEPETRLGHILTVMLVGTRAVLYEQIALRAATNRVNAHLEELLERLPLQERREAEGAGSGEAS